jgi:hypothetical protein
MDEIDLVKELFAEPVPPAPEVVERAYVRMVGGAGGDWMRRSRNPTVVLVAAASLAAAAVAAVAVTSSLSHTSPPPPGRHITTKPARRPLPTARDVFLMAANHVPASPTTGRYWRVRTMDFQVRPGGTKAHPYDLLYGSSSDEWYPVNPSQRYWNVGQLLGARPLTAADVRAWRAAGAPRTWRVQPGNAPNSMIRAAPSRLTYVSASSSQMPAATAWNLDGVTTYAQLRQLPSTVGGLRDYLASVAKANPIPGDAAQQLTLFDECVFVLNDPVSAKVKEAAFRILAKLPGTRVIGRTTEPLGRLAYELLHGGRSGAVIFVDPLHGRLTGLHWDEPSAVPPRPPVVAWLRCKSGGDTVRGIRQALLQRYLREFHCKLIIPPLYGRPYHGPLDIMTYWVSSGFTNASPPVPHSH